MTLNPTPLQAASSVLQAMDNFPSTRRVDWNILRNTLLNHLFALPYILLLDLVATHRLQGLLSPSAHPVTGMHTVFAPPAKPSHDEYIDTSRLAIADMESFLLPNMHIDLQFINGSNKRELIWRLLMRSERMRDNVLGMGAEGGDDIERAWVLGRYLIEVMKKKFESVGSMGRGGRSGPFPAITVPVIAIDGPSKDENRKPDGRAMNGVVDRVTGVVELPMRAKEIL